MKEKAQENIKMLHLLLTLGIPVAMFVTMFCDFVKASSSFTPDIFAIKFYLLFLFMSFIWILGNEYIHFGSLHSLKFEILDLTFILSAFFSIYKSFEVSKNIRDLVLWQIYVGLFLCLWEGYTMKCGYKQYFVENAESLKVRNLLSHFARIFFLLDLKIGLNHWDEYRYWLTLDFLITLSLLILFMGRSWIHDQSMIRWAIVTSGMFIILLNLYRYALVKARGLATVGGADTAP